MRRVPLALAVAAAALALLPRTLGVLRPRPIVITGLRDALVAREGRDLAALHGGEASCGWCHLELRPGSARALASDPARWLASAAPGSAGGLRPVATAMCLSCHDGSAARAVPHTLPGRRDPSIDPGGANHPVLVAYRDAILKRPSQYHDPALSDVSLEDGKVGCASCHQGHTRNGRVEGPGLKANVCLSCHNL